MSESSEMTPHQEVLLKEVYVPAFIDKCAELGVPMPNEESLHEALETAAMLKFAMNQQNDGLLKRANLSLKQALGFDKQEANEASQEVVKTAAQKATQNEQVREALLSSVLGAE